MTAFSDYLEDSIINYWLRNDIDAISAPSPIYLALFTSATSDDGTGTEVTPGGNTYARQEITFDDPAAGGDSGTTQNSASIDFLDMPGVTVTHFAVYDALTAGNMLFHGALSASVSPSAGDTVTLDAGNLVIALD